MFSGKRRQSSEEILILDENVKNDDDATTTDGDAQTTPTTTEVSTSTPDRGRSASLGHQHRNDIGVGVANVAKSLSTSSINDAPTTKAAPKPKKARPKRRTDSQSEPAPADRRKATTDTDFESVSSEPPMQRQEKFRRNRTKSLEDPSHNVSRNSVDGTATKKPYSKRKRSPTGKLLFSRRVPAAALSSSEYRLKRGLASRLPPMDESPKTDARKAVQQMFEATRKSSITGKTKPKQLAPIDHLEFDYLKHRRRNRKLAEQTEKGRFSVIH